jgi:enoyl-CoA hydratase/carnithine racemase
MSDIVTETRDAVGIITINRSERFNSLDPDTARDLPRPACCRARREIRAVIRVAERRVLQRRGLEVRPRGR